ncbi:hypothetical protein GQ53DRAFT_411177 [Thozetella sp. PMI_491]|nr:hypothetical protein GQ53DRAFT_411177 [Thozetella sp. PMI_491]
MTSLPRKGGPSKRHLYLRASEEKGGAENMPKKTGGQDERPRPEQRAVCLWAAGVHNHLRSLLLEHPGRPNVQKTSLADRSGNAVGRGQDKRCNFFFPTRPRALQRCPIMPHALYAPGLCGTSWVCLPEACLHIIALGVSIPCISLALLENRPKKSMTMCPPCVANSVGSTKINLSTDTGDRRATQTQSCTRRTCDGR